MARRNNFLVITLLVMVAVLIGAILLGKGDEGPTLPDSPREASGIARPGGPAAVRQAEAGMGEEPESERNAAAESQRESVPTQTPPTVGRHRLSGRLVFSHGKPAVGIGLDFEARTEEEALNIASSDHICSKARAFQYEDSEEVRELLRYYKMMKKALKGVRGGQGKLNMQRMMKKFGGGM